MIHNESGGGVRDLVVRNESAAQVNGPLSAKGFPPTDLRLDTRSPPQAPDSLPRLWRGLPAR